MSTLAAPVSYPVRRLEIHGQSPRLYESAHPPNVLTVTIESQQLRGSHRQGLVLIAYSGTHRLLSLRLSDLLKSPGETPDVISIDCHLNRVCIAIREQGHNVVVDFEDGRHFHDAVGLLQKSGFSIHQTAPDVHAHGELGPRLSSLTSHPAFNTNAYQAASPLGPISNSASQPTYPSNHFTPLSRTWSEAPAVGMPPVSSQATQLNPYNVFLDSRRALEPYRPQVSSPLQSAPGHGFGRHMSIPVYGHTSFPETPPAFPTHSVLSMNPPIPQSTPSWSSDNTPNGSQESTHSQSTACTVPDANPVPPEARRVEAVKNFSRMLPGPRSLPFQRTAEKRQREAAPPLADPPSDPRVQEENDTEVVREPAAKKQKTQQSRKQPAKPTPRKRPRPKASASKSKKMATESKQSQPQPGAKPQQAGTIDDLMIIEGPPKTPDKPAAQSKRKRPPPKTKTVEAPAAEPAKKTSRAAPRKRPPPKSTATNAQKADTAQSAGKKPIKIVLRTRAPTESDSSQVDQAAPEQETQVSKDDGQATSPKETVSGSEPSAAKSKTAQPRAKKATAKSQPKEDAAAPSAEVQAKKPPAKAQAKSKAKTPSSKAQAKEAPAKSAPTPTSSQARRKAAAPSNAQAKKPTKASQEKPQSRSKATPPSVSQAEASPANVAPAKPPPKTKATTSSERAQANDRSPATAAVAKPPPKRKAATSSKAQTNKAAPKTQRAKPQPKSKASPQPKAQAGPPPKTSPAKRAQPGTNAGPSKRQKVTGAASRSRTAKKAAPEKRCAPEPVRQESPRPPAPPTATAVPHPPTQADQYQDPGVLVVTDSMLRQVNRLVSGILDQYEAEGQGSEQRQAEARAQAFLDRISEVRRDYWHGQLEGTGACSVIWT